VETSEEEPDDEAFQGITGSGGAGALPRVKVTVGKFDELRG
jgi:hypothetical protein